MFGFHVLSLSSRAAGRWFSLGTPVSSSQKNDHHDIAEPLLKVALNTINLTLYPAPHIYLSEVINIRLDRIVFNPSLSFGIYLSKVIRGVQYLYYGT